MRNRLPRNPVPRWLTRRTLRTLRAWRDRERLFFYRAKRWARTRCATCGQRFAWRERPVLVATARDPGNVPSWWHGEEHLHHSRCINRPRLAYLVEGPAMLG